MRIAIVTGQCPFVVGGAELLARDLESALRKAGHQAEIVSMPFKWYPPETVLDHIVAAKALDISEFNGVKVDLAICLKFPAYLMQHPNKTFWLLHQLRQAYDLWDSGTSDLFNHPLGAVVRQGVSFADRQAFAEAKGMFTISANVTDRLQRYSDVASEVLYPPPPLAARLSPTAGGDYFYYPSRIVATKRQYLVLRSLAASANRDVRLVFSGAPDTPSYGEELRRLAADLGVEDRVEWRGFVSEAEMVTLYENARAVVFTPIDEDLGYVALEAMLAGKPLVTVTDSGEPAALVRHEVEGLVVEPSPEALGEAFDRVMARPSDASAMGRAGHERYRSLDISWGKVVSTLTGVDAPGYVPAADMQPAAPLEPAKSAFERLNLPSDLALHREYYETHAERFLTSLEMLKTAFARCPPKRILEIGTSEPYVFSVLLRQAFPDAEFTAVQAFPEGRWTHRCEVDSKAPFDIDVAGLNVETTPLPYADDAFDLVILMEVLEHFCLDPGFVFRETRRVLGTGGAFLVTTPNLISLPAIARSLQGGTPYSFGPYVPWLGAYGRHNREFTPAEVADLGRYAGFETEVLETLDVYVQNQAPASLGDYMRQNQLPQTHRGQNIFWLGRALPGKDLGPQPPSLFLVDPGMFSARVAMVADADADRLLIQAGNTGPNPWSAEGPSRIRITVDCTDQAGRVAADILAVDLPHDVAPGAGAEVALRVERGSEGQGSWYEIGLFAEGVGPLKPAGRANTVCIFAERITLEGR